MECSVEGLYGCLGLGGLFWLGLVCLHLKEMLMLFVALGILLVSEGCKLSLTPPFELVALG